MNNLKKYELTFKLVGAGKLNSKERIEIIKVIVKRYKEVKSIKHIKESSLTLIIECENGKLSSFIHKIPRNLLLYDEFSEIAHKTATRRYLFSSTYEIISA